MNKKKIKILLYIIKINPKKPTSVLTKITESEVFRLGL